MADVKDKNAYIADCAIMLYANENFYLDKSPMQIASDCVSRATTLVNVLQQHGIIQSSLLQ